MWPMAIVGGEIARRIVAQLANPGYRILCCNDGGAARLASPDSWSACPPQTRLHSVIHWHPRRRHSPLGKRRPVSLPCRRAGWRQCAWHRREVVSCQRHPAPELCAP